MMTKTLQMTLLAALLAFAARGARAELMVGDQAPALHTGRWVQGKPVRSFDTNHVYIVEFWATWCGPCIQSIPHLNQLWQKFQDKGVIAIGVDIWDSDNGVAKFVRKMGTNMTYRVALDDKSQNPDGWMAQNWWPRKVNHHGIPTAFVINKDGIIAWIGHPMTLNEHVLDQIVSGHQDLAGAAGEYRKSWQVDQKFQELQSQLFGSIRDKKWARAESALNQIGDLVPRFKNGFNISRLQIYLGEGKFDEACQLAEKLSEAGATNAPSENALAWTIVSGGPVNDRCLRLAERAAERAAELTGGQDPENLDTLARAQFMLGKKREAIATEQKAVSIASDPHEKDLFAKTAASYQAGALPNPE